MVIEYGLFALGLIFLVKSADWVIDSSSSLAKKLGVSTLIIGLTVVAFGTSLPELVVNIFAAINGSSAITFGNIVGSNIANVLLILGITAIIGKIKLKESTVWKEIPFALLASFVLFALTAKIIGSAGSTLIATDGMILLSLFAIFMYYIFQTARKTKGVKIELSADIHESYWKIFLKLLVGLVGIYFGARWVVDGAIFAASQFGLSEFLISATVIAIGTSLPELAVCLAAVKKKKIDLAIGNIVGSNIFNILWVLGIIPLLGPMVIPSFIMFDIAIMFFATLLLFIFMFVGKRHGIGRKSGIMFVIFYLLYIGHIVARGLS